MSAGGFLGLTVGGVQPQLLAPFTGAISVFGTVMLFLSLLIISSQHYDNPRGYGGGGQFSLEES